MGDDGPTVNGRPLLTADEAMQWFEDAFGCVPSPEDAASLVSDIHHCALFKQLWRPEFKISRRHNSSRLRMERIGAALEALDRDVPELIKSNRSIRPDEERTSLNELLLSVRFLRPLFRQYKIHKGRDREIWHAAARNLGKRTVDIAKASGVARVGLSTKTSPVFKVLKRAFDFLDFEITEDQIFEAVRPQRQRSKGK